MKRCVDSFFCLWLIFFCTCSASADMTLVTEEFPPFNFTEHGRLTGATTRVVEEIARRLEIDPHIDVMPWARGYQQLSSKPNVALFTTARTPERESLFHWVGPLFAGRMVFYARKSDPRRLDSLDAAKQVNAIATYKDDSGEQVLKALGFSNIDSSNSPVSDARKLASGRVDLWFFHNIDVPRVLREAGIDPDTIEAAFTYREYFSYIAISKQTSPVIVNQWQTALDEIKADGTFWWLTHQWVPPDAIMAAKRHNRPKAPFSLKLYTENSPPSAYVDKGRITGLSVDIVREILRRIGHPDTIRIVPWARGYKLARADVNTAIFSTTRLPLREPLFAWVGPLYRQNWGFYRWKGSPIAVGSMDVARRLARIGTYHQDAKMQYLQQQGFENLVPTNNNITNVKHLARGNIDLWVSSNFNMPHVARQAGVSPDHLELAYPFLTVGNYLAFSKSTSPHVVRLWQAVLDEMKSDGSYWRLCRKYNYTPQ